MTLNAGKGASHTSGKPVPNWEAAHRSIGQQALASAPNDEDRRLYPPLLTCSLDGRTVYAQLQRPRAKALGVESEK